MLKRGDPVLSQEDSDLLRKLLKTIDTAQQEVLMNFITVAREYFDSTW